MSENGKTKIFFFEDNQKDYDELKEELTKNGLYDVLSNDKLFKAFDKGKSIECVRDIIKEYWNKDLKIIICDLRVKDQNHGKDLIDKIRHDESFCVDKCKLFTALIPIIVYTETTNNKEIYKAIEAGANDFVSKPIVSSDNSVIKMNEEKVESLKRKIKEQIIYFEKKLQMLDNIPAHIKENLESFRKENKGKITAFIMTPFSEGNKKIVTQIQTILKNNNIKGYTADSPGGEYNDNLFPNIQVYLHGCNFGIGIYNDVSKLSSSKLNINPNLSLEVGYMLALQKKVGLLKDKSLEKLNSDLEEKLYIPFDIKKPDELEEKIVTWLKNKEII
jgi:CheY-like chemotaxis protein